MKKCVLMPDSFKGTMSSMEICAIMKEKVLHFFPGCSVVEIPVADGGEGTVDCFLSAVGGEKVTVTVKGPFLEDMEAFYGVIDNGETAIVEMAACAGLPLVENCKDPKRASTYGVGQLILHAIGRGCKKIIVGLGGSCTNDGGVGMAAALGVKFFGQDGKTFIPAGGTIEQVARMDVSACLSQIAGVEIVGMCDVNNPLCGESGASAVFGPQKGATPEDVAELDRNLAHLARLMKETRGIEVQDIPGAGAAGGLGAGLVGFLDSRLQKGIDIVLDTVHFEQLLQGADVVFTGEGKIDSQSLRGKVVAGVAARAQQSGVPVVAVVGDIGDGVEPIFENGVNAIVSINSVAVPFEKARLRSKRDLAITFENILRLWKLA